MIDKIDREILTILQGNSRTSNAEIARRIGMAPSAIFERIRKLEERGVIGGYRAELDPKVLGLGLAAFIMLRTKDTAWKSQAAERLKQIPEVQEIHCVAGEDCYLLKVRVADTNDLMRLMREKFSETESYVTSTQTIIVLETIKETTALPLTRDA